MHSRVYLYGLLPPTPACAPLVEQQMGRAHRYRNVLVEIERERRAKVREVMAAHPDMAPLEEQVNALVAERETALQALPRKAARNDPARANVRAMATRIRDLRGQIKAARKAVLADAEVARQLAEADEFSRERVRRARATCNVYWGTYLLQEADADRARMERMPPKFHRWTGEGRVSVQLQGGLEQDKMWGGDTRMQIDPVAPEAHDPLSPRGVRRRAHRTVLRLRVGSDAQRGPIWAEWPMLMHRPLPKGAIIKVATVSRRYRNCTTWDWQVLLTVSIPDESARPAPAAGVVALNLGFCERPDGSLRAGYLVGDDGWTQEIVVPASTSELLGKCDSIRSFRDKNLDAMRPLLSAWRQDQNLAFERVCRDVIAACETTPPELDGAFYRLAMYIVNGGHSLPSWLHERIQSVHAWRSHDRFRKLALTWRDRRFPGDHAAYELLEVWRYRDQHLEHYESGMRRRTLLRRREGYRIIAAAAAARYRTLLVDDTDLRHFQRKPDPEDGATVPEQIGLATMRVNQRLTACSGLREALASAFGSRVVKMSSQNVSRRCHACGDINLAMSSAREQTCTGCAATWDVDQNACLNLLGEHRRDDPDRETARVAKLANAKPSRGKRLSAARASNGATVLAREASGN